MKHPSIINFIFLLLIITFTYYMFLMPISTNINNAFINDRFDDLLHKSILHIKNKIDEKIPIMN